MSPVRTPSAPEVAVPLLAAAASFFTLLSWDGLSDDASGFLVPLFGIAALVALLGLGLRAVGVPRLAVPLLQALAVALLLHHQWAVGGAVGGWLPTPFSVASLGQVLDDAAVDISRYAAPVPPEATAFGSLMLLVGSVVVLAVDALATAVRRAALAGLPLLAVFTVPVSLLGGVPWITFIMAAGAFVLLLAAEQADSLGTWGRSLAGSASANFPDPPTMRTAAIRDSSPHQVRLSTLLPTAGRVGLAGIGAALLLPAVLPIGDGVLGGGGGPGAGPGDNEVSLVNPFVDLHRDLVQGADRDLVQVRTDDPDPTYLRLTVLDQFDGTQWRPSERDIPESNRVDGPLPPPPGLDPGTPRTRHTWSVRVTDAFRTRWLPTPYPVTSVTAPGDWRYDVDTLDVVGVGRGEDAAGLSYDATGLDLQPDPRALVSAGIGPQGLVFANTRVPSSVPRWVGELAAKVTSGSSSDFERAVMLQRWFREDGGFTYSLQRASGNGTDDLARFLGTGEGGRVGYCEQFAAAMALMARTLHVPARVAVGFLSPDPGSVEGTWTYSTHDLHAWPELYFQGAGWVRFEPTPQDRASDAPTYTVGAVPQTNGGPTPSAVPTTQSPTPRERVARTQAERASGGGDGGLPGWVPPAGVAMLLVAAAASPRVARELIRRRRYAATQPDRSAEGAWAEVRATTLDLGLRWDDGATLRRRARDLAPALGGDGGSVRSLERLVLLLERSRYARGGLGSTTADTATDTTADTTAQEAATLGRTVTDALLAAARPAAVRRAHWLPVSLWRRGGGGPGRRRRLVRAWTNGGVAAEVGEARTPGTRTDRVSV